MEQIEAIGGHIQHKIIQVKENLQREKKQLQRQIEEKEQEIAQYQKQQAQLTSDLDKAEVATFRLEKNLAVMMAVKTVVLTFLYDPLDLQIKDIFVEATDNVTKDLAQFISQFIPQWVALKTTLKKEYPTELEHTKAVHTVLSDMLQAISGLYIAQKNCAALIKNAGEGHLFCGDDSQRDLWKLQQ